MTWYKDVGFEYNPLCIKPFEEFDLFFDGKSLVEDVIEVIDKGENLVLKGPLGTGKTSILKKIIDEFGGKRKLFYYNAFSASSPLDFDRVLRKAGGFFSRAFNVKSKNVVLFVDEAHHLSKENVAELSEFLGSYFKSVVLASSEAKYVVPDVLKDNFKHVINISKFSEKDAFNIIENRLGDDFEDVLSKDDVQVLFEKSSTPREFLLNCEAFCREKLEN